MPSYQLDKGRDVPARLGRYELLGHLATGGMAEIHLARLAGEAGFEKIVVVKRLLPELIASPAFVTMFLDEGKLVSRLDHPNICEVHELGRDGAEYYLAMPYLDGVAVHELISRPRDPDRIAELRVAAGVIAQACSGLHHAHELLAADGAPAGLVHRDVSPSNLFVTTAGIVKVLDFGIAKVRGAAETEVGTIKGKQQYMAPEQLLGEPLDRRCDVFALGIVLYELATHQRLFKRASEYLTARAVLEEPVPRADAVDPAVPRSLADVIAKALARDQATRFADANDLRLAVEAAMAPHGGIAPPSAIGAAVTATDELSAMRTRQARVLGSARSLVEPHDELAPTRPLRNPAPPPPIDDTRTEVAEPRSFTLRTRPAHSYRRAVIASIGIAALVTLAIVIATRDDQEVVRTSGLSASQAELMGTIARGVFRRSPEPEVGSGSGVESGSAPDSPPIEMPPDHARTRAPRPGQLSIESTPYATIYVGGTKLGVTPLVKRSLPAGRHKLRAVLANGRSKEQWIEIPAGRLAAPLLLTW